MSVRLSADEAAALTYRRLIQQYPGTAIDRRDSFGQASFIIPPGELVTLCTFLRDDRDLSYSFLVDITAVDYLEAETRFIAYYHLLSLRTVVGIRLEVPLPDSREPELPTVSHIWPAANWYERELYDLFGITFINHPDMRRILMPYDWNGYPLRKDYPLTGFDLPEPKWGGQVL